MISGLGNNFIAIPLQPFNTGNSNINKFQNAIDKVDKFESSKKPSKKKTLLKLIGQIAVIMGGAVGLHKLHDYLTGQNNQHYSKALSFAAKAGENAKNNLDYAAGKLPVGIEKIAQPFKNLPKSLKITAAGLSALMAAKAIYKAGEKDGEHKVINTISKADIFGTLG